MPTPTGVVYPAQATTALPCPVSAYRDFAMPAGVPYTSLVRSKVPASMSEPGTTTATWRAVLKSPKTSAT